MRDLVSIGILTAVCAAISPAQEKTEMSPVKYDALKQEILKHRGKVLVVDFWAGY